MTRKVLWLGVILFAMAAPAPMNAGGWAVITWVDVPDQIVTGEPVTMRYAVRQHGRHLLNDLEGQVELRSGDVAVRVPTSPAGSAGHYQAVIQAPRSGAWTLTVISDFNGRVSAPIVVQAAHRGADVSAPAIEARGRTLFAAKGCVTCHVHRDAAGESMGAGPELSAGRDLAVVKRILAAARPSGDETSFGMPDLGLRPEEIAALAAFLDPRRHAPGAGRSVRARP